jgi:hypothetical protein
MRARSDGGEQENLIKTATVIVGTLLGSFMLVGAAAAQAPIGGTFVATLSGAQEAPPGDTLARGNAVIHVNADLSELEFQLVVSRLDGVTQAHIHCGPAGANGPISVFLFGFVPGASM